METLRSSIAGWNIKGRSELRGEGGPLYLIHELLKITMMSA